LVNISNVFTVIFFLKVRVPDWLGVLQSGREFNTSLRRARQSRPNFAPRLIVELNDVYNWVLRDFDGRTGSPIRVAPAQEVMDHESGDVDEEGVEVKENEIEVPESSMNSWFLVLS